jgi:SurA N-terminal domain
MVEKGAEPEKHCRYCGAELSEPVDADCPRCGAKIAASDPVTSSPDRRPLIAAGIGLALVAVVAVIVLSGSTGSRSGSAAADKLPSPKELPTGTVAFVTHAPGKRGTITTGDFNHSMELSAIQAGLGSVPKTGKAKYKRIEEAALDSLLDQVDIQGQAQEMGIAFTPKQVVSQAEQIERKNFKSQARYAAFLKRSHFTQSDVLERVELQLLSTAIQSKVTEGLTGKAARQKAFSRFVSGYSKRWRARTVCVPQHAVARCSNGPPLSRGSGAASTSAP